MRAKPGTIKPVLLAIGAAAAALIALQGLGGDDHRPILDRSRLEPVLVTTTDLESGETLVGVPGSGNIAVRRIPNEFVPSDAVRSPNKTTGMVVKSDLAAGTYVTDAVLTEKSDQANKPRPGLSGGRRPVEIEVDSLPPGGLSRAAQGLAAKVDVVVTSMPNAGADARTYIASAGVPLLGSRSNAQNQRRHTAVLGLRRNEALKLIHAEAYARSIRILAAG